MAAKRKRATKVRPRSPSRVRTKKRQRRGAKSDAHPELIGLGLLCVGLFLAAVLTFGWDGGVVGREVDEGLDAVVGAARHLLPFALVAVGGLMVARSSLIEVKPFRTGLVLLTLGLLAMLGTERGGAVGDGLESVLGRAVGETGTFLLGAFLLSAGIILVTGASVGAVIRGSAHAARETAAVARRTVPRLVPQQPPLAEPRGDGGPPVDGEAAYPDVVGSSESNGTQPLLLAQLDEPTSPVEEPEPPTLEPAALSAFPEQPSAHQDYRLPDPGVLKRSRPTNSQPAKASARTAEALLQALANFGVEATLSGQVSGPRVTRYELQLAPGTKVGKVAALKDDLAYALATTEIRILAPIPGKQAVGVEVPNLAPNIVTLGDIFDDVPSSASPLSVWLGKDISGASVWADLARMPHILIAGTTGSGKSGCINTMLCSVLLRSTPDQVRMILVDPKRVELGLYESIPHLLTPVVSSPKAAAAVLANVLAEMERRYERMSLARARNLPELNKALTGAETSRCPTSSSSSTSSPIS